MSSLLLPAWDVRNDSADTAADHNADHGLGAPTFVNHVHLTAFKRAEGTTNLVPDPRG